MSITRCPYFASQMALVLAPGSSRGLLAAPALSFLEPVLIFSHARCLGLTLKFPCTALELATSSKSPAGVIGERHLETPIWPRAVLAATEVSLHLDPPHGWSCGNVRVSVSVPTQTCTSSLVLRLY